MDEFAEKIMEKQLKFYDKTKEDKIQKIKL